MSQTENPSAFPIADVRTHDGFGIREGSPGMTLRDYFAAHAVPAIIIATSAGQHQPGGFADTRPMHERMAEDAYLVADAMLAARSQVSA